MAEQQDNNVIIQSFSNFLDATGKRKTAERYKILDRVLDFKKQFTIEDLNKSMLEENFPVSKSTLYYTMDLLVEAKILHKTSTSDNVVAFERTEHVGFIHLKCEHCGKIKLVKDTSFMAYMKARKFAAFTSSYYTLNIYGICNDCARKIKRERMKKNNKSKK